MPASVCGIKALRLIKIEPTRQRNRKHPAFDCEQSQIELSDLGKR